LYRNVNRGEKLQAVNWQDDLSLLTENIILKALHGSRDV